MVSNESQPFGVSCITFEVVKKYREYRTIDDFLNDGSKPPLKTQ